MGETGGEGPCRLAGQNRLRLIGIGFALAFLASLGFMAMEMVAGARPFVSAVQSARPDAS